MATTALSTLLPLMNVPRCPPAVQLQALRHGARRFCIETERWRETMTAFDSVADQSDYTLTLAYDNVLLHRVRQVTIEDVIKTEDKWSVSEANVLTLDPTHPTSGDDIVVKVVYVPSVLCTAIVDWMVARFGDAIAYAAEAYLKLAPGADRDVVPWLDQSGGQIAEARYLSRVGDAKREVFSSMQSGDVGVQQMGFYL